MINHHFCALCNKQGLRLVEIDTDDWILVEGESLQRHICKPMFAMLPNMVADETH